MQWKTKATIQTVIARLPRRLGDRLYYVMQRRVGGLKRPDPRTRLAAAIRMADLIRADGGSLEGRSVVEVGTGHQLNVPIGLWLCGAGSMVTVDLNRYLEAELVFEDLAFIRRNAPMVSAMFEGHAGSTLLEVRWQRLINWAGTDLDEFMSALDLRYIAPGDAARLDLASESVDYHVSYTVLEHIPPQTLAGIFSEGRRILKAGGRFIHRIDFSDHFSHSDRGISAVNFLQFSEREWSRWAGNRFMYHNRLRCDEFETLLRASGLDIHRLETDTATASLELLRRHGLVLDARFSDKPPEVNAISGAWVLAGFRPGPS